MEKTIKWEPTEAPVMQQLEFERMQTLAQIGALMMDLDNAKKNLESINERQKVAIRQALNARGIDRFDSARPTPGGLTLQIPDVPILNNGGS